MKVKDIINTELVGISGVEVFTTYGGEYADIGKADFHNTIEDEVQEAEVISMQMNSDNRLVLEVRPVYEWWVELREGNELWQSDDFFCRADAEYQVKCMIEEDGYKAKQLKIKRRKIQ